MARLIDAVLGQVIQAGDTQTLDHGKENPLEEDVGEPTQSSSGTQKTPRGRTFDFAHEEGSDEDDDEDTEETDENAEPEALPFSPGQTTARGEGKMFQHQQEISHQGLEGPCFSMGNSSYNKMKNIQLT